MANADNTTVAYIDREGRLMTRWADGEVAMGEGFVDGDRVAAITGGPDCYEVADGCIAYVKHGDGAAPELLDSHGIRDVVTPDAISFNDISPSGLVAAQVSYSDTGSCSQVFDPSEGSRGVQDLRRHPVRLLTRREPPHRQLTPTWTASGWAT